MVDELPEQDAHPTSIVCFTNIIDLNWRPLETGLSAASGRKGSEERSFHFLKWHLARSQPGAGINLFFEEIRLWYLDLDAWKAFLHQPTRTVISDRICKKKGW